MADLSTVWIDLSVYQRDIGAVRAGQKVRVETGHGDEAESSQIDFVQPLVGGETRTALARIIAPNPDGHWHPGCFVKAKVATSTGDEARVVVPDSAVIRMPDGDDVVFVLTDEGFEPLVVTLGQRSGDRVEVVSGLEPGERFVARGGFQPQGRARQGSLRRRPRSLDESRMIESIIQFSLRNRPLVMAVLTMAAGYSATPAARRCVS